MHGSLVSESARRRAQHKGHHSVTKKKRKRNVRLRRGSAVATAAQSSSILHVDCDVSSFLLAVARSCSWNCATTWLGCSVRVVEIGEERCLTFTFACLLSLCHLGLFSLHAMMAKGRPLPNRLSHTVRSLLNVLIDSHGQPRFTAYYTAPPGATLGTTQV